MNRHLRDLALRLCAAAGLLAGFLYGWHHQAHVVCRPHPAAPNTIASCANHSLTAIATPWGLALGGGLLIGSTLGLLLALGLKPKTA
jgi:hypothetical protein